jgi:flagellar assembly protein FliH
VLKRAAVAQGLADGKRQGLEQGIAEGKKSGHDQALKEHQEKLTSLISALSHAVQSFDAARGELEASGMRSVIELAAAIARRVTKRQAEIDPQVLSANLQGAMKVVSHWADLRIAVFPSQLATLREELPSLQRTWPQLKHAELIEDATLSPGGCRVFTGSGSVDGDLALQLDRVIEQVLPGPRVGA